MVSIFSFSSPGALKKTRTKTVRESDCNRFAAIGKMTGVQGKDAEIQAAHRAIVMRHD
jgi:hypothetical protein